MFGGVPSAIANMWWFPPLRRRLSSSPDAALSADDEVTTQHNKNPATGLRFTDLPPDILYTIVSKLPAKEIARSSVLSSEWRRCMRLWSACPRLTFDAVAICKCERYELSETTQVARFIPHVNDVLQKHRSCAAVETLEIRTDFVGGADGLLAHQIHIWVEFAVSSSRTKNLSLDLKPEAWWEHDGSGLPLSCRPRKRDLYVFPFQQLSAIVSDKNNTNWGSSLQQLHLSFVSFRPPSQFKGFPNLSKLHLQVLHIAREDLEHLLSRCAKIQWLHINRCVVDDQLTLATPLPGLQYLNVERGFVTKIDINAANLATFEYTGSLVPIRLVHSLNLQSANIDLTHVPVFEHALISLANGIPSVQSLTSNLTLIGLKYLEKQWSWDHPLKRFSNLRHLQLLLHFYHNKGVDKLLYSSVSFLRAAPLIEKLEVHFISGSRFWFAQGGPSRKDLGQCKCKYNQLKNVWISGFKATRGQLEFLLHVIENADALEVLRVEIGQYALNNLQQYEGEPPIEEAKQIARSTISAILPQHVTLDIV